jgi:hypothetical protein
MLWLSGSTTTGVDHRVSGLNHGVGPPSSLGGQPNPFRTCGKGISGPDVGLCPSLLYAPRTERLWPGTEAEAMLETVVAVVLCQDLLKQRQCQATGRGGAFSEALALQQVQIPED